MSDLDDDVLALPLVRLIGTSMLVPLITGMAVAAGIGGGALLVPLYSVVLGLGPKRAIPISMATICGAALGNAFTITRLRHPVVARPLIDYAIAVTMQPCVLIGVLAGVLLNEILPELAIVLLIAVVLGYTGYKTLNKGIMRWKAESLEPIRTRERLASQTVTASRITFFTARTSDESASGHRNSARMSSRSSQERRSGSDAQSSLRLLTPCSSCSMSLPVVLPEASPASTALLESSVF